MRNDFPEYLITKSRETLAGEVGEDVPVFVPADVAVVRAEEVLAAESRLGVALPKSYSTFLLTLGSGAWCLDRIPRPEAIYIFDDSVWQMKGFIGLVHNVNGVGDYVAINPSDPEQESERPVYYCSHDPFGFARVASSFEDWCRGSVEALARGESIYDSVREQVWSKWKEFRRDHPWWRFWKR